MVDFFSLQVKLDPTENKGKSTDVTRQMVL